MSKSEAPRPNLTSSEVASVSKSEVASPRSEATSVASSEVASEIDRSATSEVAEARPTDREAVDTSLRTVSTNASHPGADGSVTADVSLISHQTVRFISVVQLKFVQLQSWISNLLLSLVQATMLSMTRS